MTVDTPPVLLIRKTVTTYLEARAALAECFNEEPIDFEWDNIATTDAASGDPADASVAPLVALDAKTRVLRDLKLAGSSLRPGVLYTLRVRGCYANLQVDGASVCGTATAVVLSLIHI